MPDKTDLTLGARRALETARPGIIEATSIRVVAVRGAQWHPDRQIGADWAAYYMTFQELEQHGFSIDDLGEAADVFISGRGHKLDSATGKLQVFPNIQGPYRD